MRPSNSATGSSSWTRAALPPRAHRGTSSPGTAPREVVELRFANEDHGVVAQRLEGLAQRSEALPDRLLLYSDDGDATLVAVHGRGIVPDSTLVRRSSLEDVFLRLTGRTLVD